MKIKIYKEVFYLIIAIDGPAGAGKSTIAKEIAKIIGIEYIDTGAMYRAVSYKFLQRKIDIKNYNEVKICLDDTIIDFKSNRIYLDAKDVSDMIRTQEVTSLVSEVSAIKEVRDKLVFLQREIGKRKSAILDGRDIGTIVFPDADIKIFLTASVDIRALRRYDELKKSGNELTLEEIKKSIIERDFKDSSRKISPLKKAQDAIEVDTSNKSIDMVIGEILELVKGVENDSI